MRALIQRLGIERSPARNIVSGMKGYGVKPHNSQSTHYKQMLPKVVHGYIVFADEVDDWIDPADASLSFELLGNFQTILSIERSVTMGIRGLLFP